MGDERQGSDSQSTNQYLHHSLTTAVDVRADGAFTRHEPVVDYDLPILVTPILGHTSAIAQLPHSGYTGRHTFCPHVTRYRLMTGHQRRAAARYKACSVSSGV